MPPSLPEATCSSSPTGSASRESSSPSAEPSCARTTCAHVRHRLGDRSLEIHALVLGDHNHGGIADGDPTVAEAAAEDVRLAVDRAVELGADVILVPFFMRGQLVGEDGFDRCAVAFASLCPVAAARGVTLCFEGLLPAREIRHLAERVGSSGFGCYFDLANPLRRGLDSPTEIRALGELIRRVHVKELRVTPGDVRPGQGRVDFAECDRALDEIGYDGWLTLETPPGPPPLVSRDLSFTRSVFTTVEGARPWPRFAAISYELGSGSWDELADDLRRLVFAADPAGGGATAPRQVGQVLQRGAGAAETTEQRAERCAGRHCRCGSAAASRCARRR